MKWLFLLLAAITLMPSCDLRKREQLLADKETALQQKEQELVAWQNSLQLKEEELAKRQQEIDSTSKIAADTLSTMFASVPGVYNVTMRCSETNCAGSAVGDTRTEQWEISFQNNAVIIKATNDNKLVRVYSGNYAGNAFELLAQQDNANPTPEVKIVVRIQPANPTGLTGTREIYRANDCRIVYDLNLTKQ